MNAITPFVTALAVVPIALVLRLIQRGRPLRYHLTFFLVASNAVWLVSLVGLPLALVSRPLHSAAVLVAMYVYLGIGFFAAYPGPRSSTSMRFAAFAVIDFIITSVVGILLGMAIMASVFFP
jgi:hypothetical protein